MPVPIYAVLVVALVALPLVIQYLVSPRHNKGGEKLTSYECGIVPEGSAWVKFNVRFYVIALIFIIFDVEVIFLFPWAVSLGKIGLLGFCSMMIFLFILTVGFIYEWKKGALDWE